MQLAPALPPPPSPAPPSSGTPAIPPEERWASTPAPRYRRLLSLLVAVGPPVAAVVVTVRAIGEPVPWRNLALLTAFYFVIAHGVTVGFHRLFAHRSFEARRPLKIVLAVLGSMSFQGSIIGWVADHRRHHRFTDRAGDPHSPVVKAGRTLSGWRGMLHAHVGWVFDNPNTPRDEFAPDLLADPDIVLVDRLFVPLCIATLALPFGIGYALTGTLGGALAALLWAGVLRVGLGHHLTWAINSVCHRFGRQPFRTRDRSTNFAPLALLTGGESWHNAHHAFPTSARHGVDRGQLDTSARLIRWFEQLGWASQVRWPNRMQLDARRG
jgi:stearoyl-CoA desaturase (delta-9 desaturase)